MENIGAEKEQRPTKLDAVTHLRTLLLNENLTITPAPTLQPPMQLLSSDDDGNAGIPLKKRKFVRDIFDDQPMPSNLLSSLPLHLISNGTLSVTSQTSCVAVENGIPILKELTEPTKDKEPLKSDTKVLMRHNKVTEVPSTQVKENVQHVTAESSYIHEGSGATPTAAARADAGQSPDGSGIGKAILKALTDGTQIYPFGHMPFLPNTNQMEFLTLVGLETVVDSCCISSNDDNRAQNNSIPYQNPPICDQCKTDFTITWHYFNRPLKVLCHRCYSYNERQIQKASQTIRLANEYTRIVEMKRKVADDMMMPVQIPQPYERQLAMVTSNSKRQNQYQLFQFYMNAARMYDGEDSQVAGNYDLMCLGAAIATNPEVFEASKIVNSMDDTTTPLARAHAIQTFQIALFKALQKKFEFDQSNSKDQQQHATSLLHYQYKIALMAENLKANLQALKSENNQQIDEPLNAILRAIDAQHQDLLNTIRNKMYNETMSPN